MSKHVFILRGPSGSGKSHYFRDGILRKHPNAVLCSADLFFLDPGSGEYNFDVTKLAEAHSFCLTGFLQALATGRPAIVVDNTHARKWEYINYVHAAKVAGYEVVIVQFVPKTIAELKMCHARNSHGVAEGVLAMQGWNFERALPAVDKDLEGITVLTPDIVATAPPRESNDEHS